MPTTLPLLWKTAQRHDCEKRLNCRPRGWHQHLQSLPFPVCVSYEENAALLHSPKKLPLTLVFVTSRLDHAPVHLTFDPKQVKVDRPPPRVCPIIGCCFFYHAIWSLKQCPANRKCRRSIRLLFYLIRIVFVSKAVWETAAAFSVSYIVLFVSSWFNTGDGSAGLAYFGLTLEIFNMKIHNGITHLGSCFW